MKNYTIEDLKEEFSETKELIISLDNDSKITLKPKVEISSFLKKLAPFEADIVLDELNDMYINGMISDSYLNSKQWKRLSFEMYLQSKKDLIKSKIELERMQSAKNDINAIEKKLDELPTKASKIDYLLELQEQFEEFPDEYIDNDDVYIYLKRKIDFISKYSDNYNKKEKDKSVKQLQTGLSEQQVLKLYDLLVEKGFITDRNKECFVWAFGVTDEEELEQPRQRQPIKWLKSKGLLAYFVDIFNIEILVNGGIDRRTQWKPFEIIFDESTLRGAKNDWLKTGVTPIGYELIDDIICNVKNYK